MEERVSGNIYARPDKWDKEGETYIIRARNRGWRISAEDIEPDDLRALADRIESRRRPADKE